MPRRSRSSATGRSPTPSNTARRPSPKTRTCWPCRCRIRRPPWRWSRGRRKCLAIAFSSPSLASVHALAEWALVSVSCVVNVFDATMNSVSAGSRSLGRLGQVRAVDVRDEAKRQVAVAVIAEGLISHHRPEVRAADADVDDVFDPLARDAPSTGRCARARRNRPSCRAPRALRGTTFSPSTSIVLPTRRSQCDVQHCPTSPSY